MRTFVPGRRGWDVVGGQLFVEDSTQWLAFSLREPPIGANRLFDEICSTAGLRSRSSFAWLEHAGGRVGFTVPGIVAIGEEDLRQLASRLWTEYVMPSALAGCSIYSSPFSPPAIAWPRVWWECLRFVLAHELGHVRQSEHGVALDQRSLEADADEFAGAFGELFGWDEHLQSAIAHAMGSTRPESEHPTGDLRVAAYRRGRRGVALSRSTRLAAANDLRWF